MDISLGIALIFYIHIIINPIKKGEKLVYYYLYDVESSFPMDVYPRPFSRPFNIFVLT